MSRVGPSDAAGARPFICEFCGAEIVQSEDRFRPGDSDVEELLVGYDKLHEETGWEPQVDWREGVSRTVGWYAENKRKWYGRVDWR